MDANWMSGDAQMGVRRHSLRVLCASSDNAVLIEGNLKWGVKDHCNCDCCGKASALLQSHLSC